MSGTKSHSRTAPATETARPDLVLVAHGERGGACANHSLLCMADTLFASGAFAGVQAGVMKGEPSLESAVAACRAATLHIYPLFMADGYFTKSAIPQRLGLAVHGHDRDGRRVVMHAPFGLEPGLAGAVAAHGAAVLSAGGQRPRDAGLVVVGHGARASDASKTATEALSDRVTALDRFAWVRTAYLENPPFIADIFADLPQDPCVVVGLFSGEGLHGAEDVPAAIALRGRTDVLYAGSIGPSEYAVRLIAKSVTEAARRNCVSEQH